MGYTHYWTKNRNSTVLEWAQICEDVGAILKFVQHEQGIPLADGAGDPGTSPEIGKKHILFNGLGGDSHETLFLERVIRKPDYPGREIGWDFCKTERKPYDIAVTAVLCYLSTVTRRSDDSGEPILGSEVYTIGSDGRGSDFLAGLELARKALPRYANILDLPLGVMKRDRWCAPWVNEETSLFEVNFCIDGHGYVCREDREWYRFETHQALAQWLDAHKQATFPKGGSTGWGDYGRTEPNIWNATGCFDDTRRKRIARAQNAALIQLFPAPAENAHEPPAYVRPDQFPEDAGRPFCYSIPELLNLCNAA